MNKPKTQMIGLSGIAVPPPRMRGLQPNKVDEIAESIRERGLLQPIIIRPCEGTGYLLIAGRHRLEAVRKLKHNSIECRILEALSADEALVAEIDENLMRADLTPSERAAHHAKRKELYLKLHPDICYGAPVCISSQKRGLLALLLVWKLARFGSKVHQSPYNAAWLLTEKRGNGDPQAESVQGAESHQERYVR
jgi:hypothetical protein